MEIEMVEKIEKNKNPVTEAQTREKSKIHKIVLAEEDGNELVNLCAHIRDLLFEFYSELHKLKNGKTNLSRIKEIIILINGLKEKYLGNEEAQLIIDKYLKTVNSKMSEVVKNSNLDIYHDELKKILLDMYKGKVPVTINLSKIDVDKIVELYEQLNNAIEEKDLKKITVSRGRLIKKLKKEKNNIDSAFYNIETLVKINDLLDKSSSIEKVKEILELEENRNLLFYFEDKLVDMESFKNSFEKVFEDKELQKLIYLHSALFKELEKHSKVLEERYSKEFLDKKSTLSSLVMIFPNAVALSIKRLANSINELKQAKTNRRKIAFIADTMKKTAGVIGTPLIYTGKFLASNWYSLYMSYKGLSESKYANEVGEQNKETLKVNNTPKTPTFERAMVKDGTLDSQEQNKETPKVNNPSKTPTFERAMVKDDTLDTKEQNKETGKNTETQLLEDHANTIENVEPVDSTNQDLKGSRLCTIFYSLAFDGNISDQLKYGYVTPDTKVSVTYVMPNTPFWKFWEYKHGEFTLRELQEIWGWFADIDLDLYSKTESLNQNVDGNTIGK